MWGPGAEQGEILQTSSCKLDLKEPYYRMSQPQAYALAQDQQPQTLLHTQVFNLFSFISWLRPTKLNFWGKKWIFICGGRGWVSLRVEIWGSLKISKLLGRLT